MVHAASSSDLPRSGQLNAVPAALNAMAKAKYEAWRKRMRSDLPWEDCHELTQAEMIDDMRAALLALAEAELPEDVTSVGVDHAYSVRCHDAREAITVAFRAMLRALAKEEGQ